MKVLGIDPGLDTTGCGLIEVKNSSLKILQACAIKTSAKDKLTERVTTIYNNLTSIINKHIPDVIVLEELYSHYKHPVTSVLMGHARGVICLIAGQRNIPLVGFLPTRVKKAVVGRGNASKEQVQFMVMNHLRLSQLPTPFDLSDALALSLTYIWTENQLKTKK